jgi:cell division protein FtsI (penicillin-binding protein 3)
MECESGDLLAMANLGRRSDATYGELENYALGRRMEPGSTFKLAALLALLEDCGKDLSLTYDSGNGATVEVGRALVTDAHEGYSVVDLKTATAQSLNVFYAKAIYEAYRDNPERYVAFLKHLHLDRPMGLEAFGERTPLLPEPGQKGWYPHVTLPNLGYGYAIELTPIQILTLYNAVANEGKMVAPRLVREIQRQGRSVEEFPTQVLVEEICSPKSLALAREALEEVALSGTAKYYFGDTTRYRVGAKTGTAKFAQGDIHYKDGYYLGTMVTYLPAERPQYTLLTAIFTRRGNGTTIYGAGLAGPVQQRVANYLSSRIERKGEVFDHEETHTKKYQPAVGTGDAVGNAPDHGVGSSTLRHHHGLSVLQSQRPGTRKRKQGAVQRHLKGQLRPIR